MKRSDVGQRSEGKGSDGGKEGEGSRDSLEKEGGDERREDALYKTLPLLSLSPSSC